MPTLSIETLLKKFPDRVLDKIKSLCSPTDTHYKFALKEDSELYANAAIEHCRRLHLDDSPPLCILDIGAGPCWFATAAQMLGHSVVMMNDRDPVFQHFAGAFPHIRYVWHELTPNVRLPEVGRLDLVTAMGVNLRHGSRWWEVDDFQFLWDDLRTRLNDGGRINWLCNWGPRTDWVANTNWTWDGEMWANGNVVEFRL